MRNLEDRVIQFHSLELPGQPRIMHMGTAYLINDLWREVQDLHAALRDLLMEPTNYTRAKARELLDLDDYNNPRKENEDEVS